MIKMSFNRCKDIHKFGNKYLPLTYKTQVEFRSHFSVEKVRLMVREIRYIFGGYGIKFWLTWNVSYIKFCGMEPSHTSRSVCFRHVYSWKVYILIILRGVLLKNDEKINVNKNVRSFTSVCVNTVWSNCPCGLICTARLQVNVVYFDGNTSAS